MKRFVRFTEIILFIITAITPVFFEKYIYLYGNLTEEIRFSFLLTISVILACPTMSLALYYQMVGRSIRPHPSKKCSWTIDLCGTYKRIGKVENLELRAERNNLWALWSGGKQLTNIYFN